MKEGAKIPQQEGRRIPIQLQNQGESEVKKLLKDGHIEKVNKFAVILRWRRRNRKGCGRCRKKGEKRANREAAAQAAAKRWS